MWLLIFFSFEILFLFIIVDLKRDHLWFILTFSWNWCELLYYYFSFDFFLSEFRLMKTTSRTKEIKDFKTIFPVFTSGTNCLLYRSFMQDILLQEHLWDETNRNKLNGIVGKKQTTGENRKACFWWNDPLNQLLGSAVTRAKPTEQDARSNQEWVRGHMTAQASKQQMKQFTGVREKWTRGRS